MQCNILYKSSDIGKLRAHVMAYLRHKDFDRFKTNFIRGDVPQEVRIKLKETDTLSEIQQSVLAFYSDLKTITDSLIARNPDQQPLINNLLSQIETKFHIDADETQSASEEFDSEVKTLNELYDSNRSQLHDHLKDIYGLESHGIITQLAQDFNDLIIEAAYYNSKTGEYVNIDNKVLNQNITARKQQLLEKLKSILQEHDIPFNDTFYGIQSAFYNYIKSLPDLKQQLSILYGQKLQGTVSEAKSKLFQQLINDLQTDNKFNKYILPFLNRWKKNRLDYALYSGDCYSTSYLAVRKYIIQKRPDLINRLHEIEATENNLLEAVNAYTILSHFDEMLVEQLGKQISIEDGTKDIEVPNKYSYHQDTSHEIKGWQTSEDIGSEKHTSKFAHAVFSQIRIFDHKTDEFKNRRLDSTSFIVAVRHLMDDILYGNAKINGNSEYIKKCRKILIEDIITFHQNPQVKLKEILQILFDITEGLNQIPLKNNLINKKLLTDYDLDILYSVYIKVFDENNPSSFISQEKAKYKANSLGSSLMQEIAAYADCNITMDYLESTVDWETGEIDLKVKKKFFNNEKLYKLRKAINSEINTKSLQERKRLQNDLYKLTMFEPADKKTQYSVTVGGEIITLQVANSKSANILTHGSKGESFTFANSELFDLLDEVDLVIFRQKLKLNDNLKPKEVKLKQLLQFLDDYLNLNILSDLGLQTLQIYKATYSEIDGMKNYLMPLVQLAIRAAYVNNQYINAGDKTLAEYLKDDSLYQSYKANPKTKLFSETFGNVKYVVASFADKVLDAWVNSISMLDGSASKATTKDGQGNAIPNNSVGKLGGILHYYLNKQKGTNCDSLMFVDNPSAIKATFHDLEAGNIHGDVKSIKQFSCGELFHHSIWNKFWANYNKSGNVIIQPTVYSDKTTFLNWEISSKLRSGVDLMSDPNYIYHVLKEYKESLGTFYLKVYNSTMDKLNKIADAYNADRLEKDPNYVPLSTKDVLKNLTEQQLRTYGTQLKIDLEKDKDYRRRKKTIIIDGQKETIEYCTFNEILEYNARVYNDETLLRQALEHEKYNFLQNLIDYNVVFQVLDFNDNIDYYLSSKINEKATSKNAIITTILNSFKSADERIKFFEEWVDSKTGRLILAKQNNEDILGVNDDFDPTIPGMELNPFLSRFFYVEGLMSNNLRMSLTGSEINHPDKAFDTLFNKVKKSISDKVTLKIDTGIDLNDVEFANFKSIIDNCDDITDLLPYLDNPFINQIYDKTITKIINTAQGTQFKRNVIIPATLQYCQQNVKDGIPSKVKVAVIYDEKAPVHNYRGETTSVDSADGSAKITPFQSIMENLALGSQAVGFIKKPIWHSYDTSGGTAFLAKFATNTITNEEMRASMHSKTSVFRLFKQMTNLPWEEPIDLTKPLHKEVSVSEDVTKSAAYDLWFQNVILEGQNLFYENKFGEKIQILAFNKTTTEDGTVYYYTEEKSQYGKPRKVYHMFDEQSNHYTFDSYQKAQTFKAKHEKNHTIKSLFELHTALGGIYCVDSTGKTSEFNNKVVVNFMNNIGTPKEGVKKTDVVNQETYDQPLKKYHIGYALNNTAVKNGAKNINPASAWEGNTKLAYFEVDSDGLGMQMNADHDIVNSELTEFSQVIAATSAYGYTYDNCHEIFKGLAKTALQASKQVLESVDKFLKNTSPDAHSDLYDAIGRIILVGGKIKDKENLKNVIKEAVTKVFNKYKNHDMDDVQIPFSDSNIYDDFIATLASTITSSSIKRKHPGSGCVMVPGYNIITYFEIGDKKYSHKELLNLARKDLKEDLKTILKLADKYNPESNTYNNISIDFLSLEDLIQYVQDDALLEAADSYAFNQIVIDRYLNKLQKEAPIFSDKSYFQPEDVVRILIPKIDQSTGQPLMDEKGEPLMHESLMVLDSMKKYYDFKGYDYPSGTLFQVDIKTPRNLKPSLIRWRYIDDNGKEVYMNIFDHPVIKTTFALEGELNANYRQQVQNVLHNLYDGFFEMNGRRYNIVPNSLENTEAELVMSNIYKETFGIENESLQEILDQGEQFFRDQISQRIHAPVNRVYDIALLNDNGKHALIKFGEVVPNDMCVEYNFENISVNDKDEIYCMKGNRPLFKIGKYFDLTDEDGDLYIDDNGKIASRNDRVFDEKLYRIHKQKIQKRVDFIQRYKLTTKSTHRKTGQVYYTTNVMYKIIKRDTLEKLYGNVSDAYKQIGAIINSLYQQDEYKFIELNSLKGDILSPQQGHLEGYFGLFFKNDYINPEHKKFIRAQLDSLGKNTRENLQTLTKLKQEFYETEAHKKWVSFQDSLKFISSRIPAQTLQSFMAMKCVGWTDNTKNMAYVSHFQIYLQGSDYDIDKAYIMGQSYDSNGVYIKWSPLFDYTDIKTLELSKQLPSPENVNLELTEDGINLNYEFNTILNNTDENLQPLSYEKRIENLKTYIQILRKINKAGGRINYNIPESKKLKELITLLYKHIKYSIPENVAEAAYKNVASANIYAVSHDVRNRDQGYTAISMEILQKAAEKSPKGEQAATLNMLNPLTKYVMQYQNIVGKNVISIAANGEKVWFNAYYYWSKLLKEDRTKYLQFQTKLNRVEGRSKVTTKTLNELPEEGKTVKILPDLNVRDLEIKSSLLSSFGIDVKSEEYAYVDQLISQLLSAATDNAKELILAKINSGNNFARMYVYLIMTGYNFDDIVSFMISPVSEFIDSMSNPNMFQEGDLDNRPSKAINLARGIVKSYAFLHGTITVQSINTENGDTEYHSIAKSNYLRDKLKNSGYLDDIKIALGLTPEQDIKDLDTLMQGLIKLALLDSNIDIASLVKTSDMEINIYLQYCQNIVYKLRKVLASYSSLAEMEADVEEFRKIYQLSSEISSIASAWLGLNQGLPTDELSFLKRFDSMKKIITAREDALDINVSKMFTDSTETKQQEAARDYFNKVVRNIINNNPALTESEVEQMLLKAKEKNLIRTFDVYRYLTDDEYRKDMIEYTHYIKGTLNVLDMMEEIPHYKEIINCLKALAVSKQTLSSKSRLITTLIEESDIKYLTDQQLKGIIRYVDRLNALNFAKTYTSAIVLEESIEGFNSYFEKQQVDKIDLSTLEGLATFKHWVEHEFLEELRSKYADNPLIPHLQRVSENQRDILATDIDLLNPNTTSITRQSYDDILRGMAMFELIPYKDTEFTIAGIFQLYNIIVNSNQYGSERLTTIFKACSDPESVLNKYLNFIAKQDYAINQLQDYELIDYYINAAPIVSTGAERFRTEKFIKVNDPVEGFILKRYNFETNQYEPYSMIPAKAGIEPTEERLRRLQNFVEYCPFEMPAMSKMIELFTAIDYDGEVNEEILTRIKNILLDFSSTGKLIMIKDC